MEYRTFGSTGLQLSVFTLGTMRFVHGWDAPHDHLPDDSLENCHQVLQRALDIGINLIETARGYGKSERLIGRTLPKLKQKRDDYYLMTKASPAESAAEMRVLVEEALHHMRVDHIDLFALHGINRAAHMDLTFKKNGALEGLQQAQREGLIGHIGFSTHGSPPLVLKLMATGAFAFVNLHYYALRRDHAPCVALAQALNMGLFVISPNDKGGRLYQPPAKLSRLTAPLHPVNYNERWLLSQPHVHTLSVGISQPEHAQIHLDSLAKPYWGENERRAEQNVAAALMTSPLDRCGVCQACLPCPEKIELPDLLRFSHFASTLDMDAFSRYRYGQMHPDDHWMPGNRPGACTDCGDCLPRCPQQLDIPTLVRRTEHLWPEAVS